MVKISLIDEFMFKKLENFLMILNKLSHIILVVKIEFQFKYGGNHILK